MPASQSTAFHYHASAHALSGTFSRPIQKSIEVQGSVALPLGGGHGQAGVESFAFEKRLSFSHAYSRVSGSKGTDNKHHTEATVAVAGLNILDVVTADRVVGRLTSEHDPAQREGHILALGSRFDNLCISGHPVRVVLDHQLFLDTPTYDHLSKKVAGAKKSGKMAQESNGVIVCSLVKSMEIDCPGITVEGHVITVPHFGKIYVCEIIAEPGKRLLSMLRLELGSPDAGMLAIAQPDINGRPWP
ncbi:MAG TPA: hypothetical protein VL128_19185 [Candidatus Eisenbacteria bacterium]|nr:hypothetical protein [Candidatus Eisenbacteria bacterium]